MTHNYKFEDFYDPQEPSLEELSQLDKLQREVDELRIHVRDTLVYDFKSLEERVEHRINQAAEKIAQKVDRELLISALDGAQVQQQVQQVVEEIFQREAQQLFEAVCRAVMKRLGRGL